MLKRRMYVSGGVYFACVCILNKKIDLCFSPYDLNGMNIISPTYFHFSKTLFNMHWFHLTRNIKKPLIVKFRSD